MAFVQERDGGKGTEEMLISKDVTLRLPGILDSRTIVIDRLAFAIAFRTVFDSIWRAVHRHLELRHIDAGRFETTI